MSSISAASSSLAAAALEKETVLMAQSAKTERVAAQAVVNLLETSVEDAKARNTLSFNPTIDKLA